MLALVTAGKPETQVHAITSVLPRDPPERAWIPATLLREPGAPINP